MSAGNVKALIMLPGNGRTVAALLSLADTLLLSDANTTILSL
jgi:hypothetical protein